MDLAFRVPLLLALAATFGACSFRVSMGSPADAGATR